ncbi:hypothetical protein TSTA_060740 [Talaromyces stipitatus ATCC 10500]|uniref:RING-type domain-containing protein n=1 Tax=Talaromyces stipitatus (strain ATCC 10500 / CBS 375.48 / QM 6759 / NRRL 1006) TaxID=441959 RepID=B8LUB0_TALSN|nr:uncharacterized protein TSTA_060740 [Talaromyces stipitatus ATCC 10500]EED22582.1 hypothetical protein TSTA_060740 [Talaromyces stipitatus ATCC 10500]
MFLSTHDSGRFSLLLAKLVSSNSQSTIYMQEPLLSTSELYVLPQTLAGRIIEAARTAAVKRTCPRCNLSFVKSSDCNKLTCICGYSMCYVCRKALNGPSYRCQEHDGAGRNVFPLDENPAEAEADEGETGYKHLFEHFRVNPGTRCTECNKCELCFSEDEEAIACKAGEQAEREWRLRQTMMIANNNKNINMNNSIINQIQSGKQGPGSSSIRWEDHQSQKHPDLYRIPTMYNHHNRSSQYWLIEVWREGCWRWEIQTMADKLVERVVVIVDIS